MFCTFHCCTLTFPNFFLSVRGLMWCFMSLLDIYSVLVPCKNRNISGKIMELDSEIWLETLDQFLSIHRNWSALISIERYFGSMPGFWSSLICIGALIKGVSSVAWGTVLNDDVLTYWFRFFFQAGLFVANGYFRGYCRERHATFHVWLLQL